jgi:hypothetical protein
MPEPILPLPAGADYSFWTGEVERADREYDAHKTKWQENLDYYTGQPLASPPETDYVNVNVDFYQVEQKLAQLFYETPELQVTAKPALVGAESILQTHRQLLNEVMGPDHADVLTTIHKAIKECLCTSGFGATKICYQPTVKAVPAPQQFGAMLGLQPDVQVPIYEEWIWTDISSSKLRIPADFKSSNYDKAPWLGFRFRMPLTVAQSTLMLPADFTGTTTKDEHQYQSTETTNETAGLHYVDGIEIWYRAAMFDSNILHPEAFRRLVLIDGLDQPAAHADSPYQTFDGQGRLTPDSMIGNPIHIFAIRDVPDSAYVPSDSQMTRPLVKELCRFRTQMVKERDANRPRVLYDSDKLPPEVIAKMASGEIGDLIPTEGGALAQGVQSIMAVVQQGQSPRQTYLANDIITRDIEKTHAIDASGAGVTDTQDETATKTATVDRNRAVRLDAERARILRQYLKGVAKFSALVVRYLTPDLAARYVGPQAAQAWAQAKAQIAMGFTAKPDSQIRLDAAQERRYALQLYQMCAQDPNVVRVELLKDLFMKAGRDPAKLVVEQLPEKTPEPNISYRFNGEDLYNPMVREILAQAGVKISQDSIDQSASQMYKQVALGLRDVSGKAVPPTPRPMEHVGPAQQVRSLSKQQGDETGQRPGPAVGAAA